MAMMTVAAGGAGRRPPRSRGDSLAVGVRGLFGDGMYGSFQDGVVSMIHGVMSTGSRVDGVRGEIPERTGLATAPEHRGLMVT